MAGPARSAGRIGGPKADRWHRTIFYQYRTDRATRTLRGIDEQIAKAEKAIKGQAAVKRNRFVQLTGGTRTINRTSRAKTRALAGLKGCAKHAAGWVRCSTPAAKSTTNSAVA